MSALSSQIRVGVLLFATAMLLGSRSAEAQPKADAAPAKAKAAPVKAVAPPSAAVATLATPKPAVPKKVTSVEGIAEYRLPNGMRVLLYPDMSKPTVTVNITYL